MNQDGIPYPSGVIVVDLRGVNDVNQIMLVETSGLAEFELTRRFYEKGHYHREAVIREFYNEGEDKVVFWKKLN